jgi:hypothetical protein
MDELPLDANIENKFQWHLRKRYQIWREMVQRYSMRELTVASDRFPGLSGLASEMAYLLNDEYIGGLWKGDMINCLCWSYSVGHRIGSARKTNYGPTWSWAKTTAPISYELIQEDENDTPTRIHTGVVSRSRSWSISKTDLGSSQSADEDLSQKEWTEPLLLGMNKMPSGDDPNGTLLSASIRFEGQLTALRRSKTGNCILHGEAIEVIWDYLPQPVSEIFLFSLGRIQVGLALEAEKETPGVYKRVGIVSNIKWNWFKNIETQLITLV